MNRETRGARAREPRGARAREPTTKMRKRKISRVSSQGYRGLSKRKPVHVADRFTVTRLSSGSRSIEIHYCPRTGCNAISATYIEDRFSRKEEKDFNPLRMKNEVNDTSSVNNFNPLQSKGDSQSS